MLAARQAPDGALAAVLTPEPVAHDSEGRPQWNISRERRDALVMTLRRYYCWADSGRKHDPWASGADRASSLAERVRGSAPGSRPPGSYSPPDEVDATLLAVERALEVLPLPQRNLVRWKTWGDDGAKLTIVQIADRLQITDQACVTLWRVVSTKLHYRLGRL